MLVSWDQEENIARSEFRKKFLTPIPCEGVSSSSESKHVRTALVSASQAETCPFFNSNIQYHVSKNPQRDPKPDE
jgi:hypothetical protein